MRTHRLLALALVGTTGIITTASDAPASADISPDITQLDLVGPAGSETFGADVLVLSNGNYVVTDVLHDEGGVADVGAVHLYDGMSDTVISTLTGSTASDEVGSGGIFEVGDSNFVVASGDWDNGGVVDAGAVTWVDGEIGLSGTVSATNSFIGSAASEWVGSGPIVVLTNGNFVVGNGRWDGGKGAVTLIDGNVGMIGSATSSNSLVGVTTDDGVGYDTPVALTNGSFVVGSSTFSAIGANGGAATWSDGEVGVTGPITEFNSLLGEAGDEVGSRITPLTDGDYVVESEYWDGAGNDYGAATWGNGEGGTVGMVDATNSLVGSSDDDLVGRSVFPLTNGNYVVASQYWDGPGTDLGAVTWGDGDGGTVGEVSDSNSLVGSDNDDRISNGGIFLLTNGNYVVSSTLWDGAGADLGAATWGDGATGSTVGEVSAANSLIGEFDDDYISSSGITVLTNGNYVVNSPDRNTSDLRTNTGAVTWGDGNGGTVGVVDASNSLIGGDDYDGIAVGTQTIALTNGHWVTASLLWDGEPGKPNVGAVTWGNGESGTVGEVTLANSLTGPDQFDFVGGGGLYALPTGDYLVASPLVDGDGVDRGAITWGNGNGGTTGVVSAANSLVGTADNDRVGNVRVTVLDDGDYVVRTPGWGADNLGAVTFGSGSGGVTGPITSANSLVGTSVNDAVGNVEIVDLDIGGYLVGTTSWDDAGSPDAGAVTFGRDSLGVAGAINASNSVIGTPSGVIRLDTAATRTTSGDSYPVPTFQNRVLLMRLDREPAFATTPPDVDVEIADDETSAVVTYTSPAADDVRDGPITSSCTPASGSTFPIGDTVVTCTATDSGGQTATTTFTVSVTVAAPDGPEVVSLNPGRVFASRASDETVDDLFQGDGRIAAGDFVEVDINGRAGVADDAQAVVMNVTAINPSGRGFVTTYPCGDRPLASSLNYGSAGAVVGNELVAKLSADGSVCVYTSAETDLTIDVVGYVPSWSDVISVDPARVYATRASDETVDGQQEAEGRVDAGSFIEVDIAGRGGVAASGAGAVVMNITAINPSGRGFITVYPCGDRPLASSLNYGAAGAVVGNELIAKLSATGSVCAYSSAETDLTVDVVGYVPSSSAATSVDPGRVYATRTSDETVDEEQQATGRIDAGEFVEVDIAGRAGVPASGAGAVVMNITAINPSGRGFITTYPCGTRPLASSLNYGSAGAVVGNELVAKLSADGTVCVFSSAATDLTVDVVGYIPA
ncbi:hypothetical protein YM304_35510 [Ilumatobacter coccineus YM16-304]|uniref:HYR domain-containing protein n=2 Tax=Ilumatobacter coccineus TaxID=467094 RepID=A0A6C7EFR9_ILUCY|nr:hypothetical protein YM304_35510 [Ilumatobacter coccineus YM16-304]